MNLPGISRIYHGGGIGGSGGFSVPGRDGIDGQDGRDGIDGQDGRDGIDGQDGRDGIDGQDGKDGIDGQDGIGLDAVRIMLDENSFHQGYSEPGIAALHTTGKDSAYGYKTYDLGQGKRIFATFALPHKRWSKVLTGNTGIGLKLFGYIETKGWSNPMNISIVCSLTVVWPADSFNYDAPVAPYLHSQLINAYNFQPYQMITWQATNMQIHNPGGTIPNYEPVFHLRIRRNDSGGGDQYSGNDFRLQCGFVEFPLV